MQVNAQFNSWDRTFPWRREWLPLQYPSLENPMDCVVHGVAKSWTQLDNFHFHGIVVLLR